ncbi:signal transduction histidine kinase [Nonomuraea thailandensis]|uniref:histidine kinase n=1 Tax=Nonomuraea thailandensis TaxID=1188745 RepID=A0A9X2GSZ0_9ACTN|nr:sensor histidine kinase [Nonomuraea thailandensis]MCP2363435.1 signal transduction histidine kinase [Nonomuraea thailandensis]
MSSARGWRSFALDGALAAVVAALLSLTALATPGAGALDLAAVLVASAALLAWRRAPLVALAITTVCMLVFSAHAQPGPPAAFPVLMSVYGAARAGHRLFPVLAGVVFLGSSLAGGLAGVSGAAQEQQILQNTTLLLGWFLAAGVGGTVSMHRQAYVEQAEQRAAEAERTREEVARRRAGEERLRIARELHDSLTHSISVIKVQAGVAVHLARKRGEEVPAALLAIQEAGGDAMRELRTTLELLRDADGDPGEQDGPSGLARLGDLVERARSTGLPATVTVTGQRRELPAEVDRAAYRIVQEALTNVSRHAGAAAAAVRIDYAGAELVVQVDDDGRAGVDAPPVPGVGLLGMRERVTALGGSLLAGPRAEGGFTVRAELPLREPS